VTRRQPDAKLKVLSLAGEAGPGASLAQTGLDGNYDMKWWDKFVRKFIAVVRFLESA
jgi:hypothetical protein